MSSHTLHLDVPTNPNRRFQTLVELLQFRAQYQPDDLAYTFLKDGVTESHVLTYKELDARACAVAALLQNTGSVGGRALLLFPPGLEFTIAFFGCLYAGVTAVPVYPPKRNHHTKRLKAVADDAQARIVLTTLTTLPTIQKNFAGEASLAALQCLAVDTIDVQLGSIWRAPAIQTETLAFLQYTSGSTGNPKGVMVSHANLLHNLTDLDTGFSHPRGSVMVTWLPTFHDMGLVYGILMPLFAGFPCYMMPPAIFLQKPYLWLKAMTRYKGTHTVAPNFAFDLCARKITPDQIADLNLSTWRVAVNGAEPVLKRTFDEFVRVFGSVGFSPKTFCPSYGLAEATLKVTTDLPEAPPSILAVDSAALAQNRIVPATLETAQVKHLLSCGPPLLDSRIVIVNPETLLPCSPTEIGEIWVSSGSVAQGYWNRREQSAATFGALLAHTGDGPFLRTGDLGFLNNGQLYITGRLKDLVIVHGHNHYPQDIEQSLEQCHPSFRASCSAAFAVNVNNADYLVVAVEVERTFRSRLKDGQTELNTPSGSGVSVEDENEKNAFAEEAFEAVRHVVAQEHELQVDGILLLRPGSIPKTSSGKIQRQACRIGFLEKSLNTVGLWVSDAFNEALRPVAMEVFAEPEAIVSTRQQYSNCSSGTQRPIQSWLQEWLAREMKVSDSQIKPDRTFPSYGLDSITAVSLVHDLQMWLGKDLQLDVASVWDYPSVEELAKHVAAELDKVPLTIELAAQTRKHVVPDLTSRYQPFPLTDIQTAYWMGRSGSFELGNVACHLYLEKEYATLDLVRYNQAWCRLIQRHEMLRAIILADGQQQILESVPPYNIELLDLRATASDASETQLARIRERMSHQVLTADKWPLFEIRASLLPDCTRIHISFDLLIADAWSLLLLFRELESLYQIPDHSSPALHFSFRDYVLAEQSEKCSSSYQASLRYWMDRVPSLPLGPELPLAKSLDSIKSPKFKPWRAALDASLWTQLQSRAAEARLTASGVVLAAFSEVLAAWSKQPQFSLNLTLFNRQPFHPEANALVGDFTSSILLAVVHDRPGTFAEKARSVQSQLWKDLEHRQVSGVTVLRELAREHKEPAKALAPVVFTSTLGLHRLSRDESRSQQPGFLNKAVYTISQTPQVYLDHQVFEEEGCLILHWDAVAELFPEGLLTDMFEAYVDFLKRLACDEEAWTSPIRKLTPSSHLALFAATNATKMSFPLCLLHLPFVEQAQTHPDRPAVISANRILTYGELYRRANQIAHQLRAAGATPNQLIAITMEKGWEQIVATYAILIAGAAYVPIDPDLPEERRLQLLAQAEVQFILTQSRFDTSLAWPVELKRIAVDHGSAEPSAPLPSVQQIHDLAYVIYTSGSTGVPKGVMIDHQGAINTVLDINQRFHVTAQDRVIAISSLSFDLSVYDIFGTLTAGGTIVMPEAQAAKDPAHWLELICREQVTVWNSVPALMQILMDHAAACRRPMPSSLRLVMLSGDWIPLALPDQIKAAIPSVQVISLGGATEASIWSIYHPIDRMDPSWKSIPYGRPLANQRFYVLNSSMEPCPVWAPGQLYIGGVGLAKGYWRNEQKTRDSFLTNPHTGEPLYRTGDLGRYLPDGNIEFLGREDFQVKIQGYRIELGEIESALLQHPGVRSALASVVNDNMHAKRLAAYIVPEPGADEPATCKSLREFLKGKLPVYMIPSAFVFLESFPLTANGKVNRRCLPAPDSLHTESDGQAQTNSPRTPLEQMLAKIWQKVTKISEPDIHRDFFESGGDSLRAIQVVQQVRDACSVNLPLRLFFQSPTIAGLAQAIETLPKSNETPKPALGLNLSAEAILDPQIVPAASELQAHEPESIFLTGPTGFLGAFLIRELLEQTQADIYCLVRCADVATGQKRLQSHLESYGLWEESFASRVIPVQGDLAQPRLGLVAKQFEELAHVVDVIYHGGAHVNFIYPYSVLKPANVLGTEEVLRLAVHTKLKPVHHISTTTVLYSQRHDPNTTVLERELSDEGSGLHGGYAQSKWAAERLASLARERGVPVYIYRPGFVSGHSQTGRWNFDELVCRMIKGVIQLGIAPNLDVKLDMSPVDYVSRSIAHISRRKDLRENVFHLINPQSMHWSQIVEFINSLGYPVQMLSYSDWKIELVKTAGKIEDSALHPMLPFFTESWSEDGLTLPEIYAQARKRKFDCQNTLSALKGTDIQCPPVNAQLLTTYINHFIETRFMKTELLSIGVRKS